jgi:translocation and assembly module TamA
MINQCKRNTRQIILFLIFFGSWTEAQASNKLENQIIGISGESLKNVQTWLTIAQNAESQPLQATVIHTLYQQAPENIRKALEPFGYFKPTVSSALVKKGNTWYAYYTIRPGPQMQIQDIQLKITGAGSEHSAFQKLLVKFPLKKDQPLLTESYEAAKKNLLITAEKLGYLNAYFVQHQMEIDLKRYKARVVLHFDTGTRYYFGAIHFEANPLDATFLKQYAPFKEGQPYSSKALLQFQDSLSNSQYFEQVFVQPASMRLSEKYIPIQVNLKPKKRQQYQFGVGYGTDTSARASIGANLPYFTANGHRIATLLRLSSVKTSLQAAYSIPGKNPLTEQYSIQDNIFRTIYPSGDSYVKKVGVSKTKTLNDWENSIALNYQQERYRLNNQPYERSHHLIPSIALQYKKADNPIYPSHASYFRISLQGASTLLLSESSLLQAKLEQKYIRRIFEDGRMILRGDLGYTIVKQETETLPLSLNFFAGGERSVRGYTYQSLGPGRYLVTGSAEYQHRIKGNWNAAIFYDVGNAFNNFSSPVLKHSAGVGIVWVSPIGPVNVSIAKAFNLPGEPLRLVFTMGADL